MVHCTGAIVPYPKGFMIFSAGDEGDHKSELVNYTQHRKHNYLSPQTTGKTLPVLLKRKKKIVKEQLESRQQ